MYQLSNNTKYEKKFENLSNIIDVKLVNNEKDYLKCTSKPSYVSHKIFDNNLVAIRKSKLTLKLNKSEYIGMCILDLSKVLMSKFCYDHFKNKYNNKLKLLFTDTVECMKLKLKMSMKILAAIKNV